MNEFISVCLFIPLAMLCISIIFAILIICGSLMIRFVDFMINVGYYITRGIR